MDPQFIEVETDFTYGEQSKSKEQFQSKILSQNFKKSEMLDVVGQGHVCVCVCVCVCAHALDWACIATSQKNF